MVKPLILFVGNVAPQSDAVYEFLDSTDYGLARISEPHLLAPWVEWYQPDFIVVAGWRHLVPPEVLAIPRLGTVGFHSAKLPEYPGRAPVPWTLLRGDRFAYNTLFYLDEGIDTGDVIDREAILVRPDETPETLYEAMAVSCVRLLRKHLPALLDGTTPRTPQDPALRGPLTTKDGWQRWAEQCAS